MMFEVCDSMINKPLKTKTMAGGRLGVCLYGCSETTVINSRLVGVSRRNLPTAALLWQLLLLRSASVMQDCLCPGLELNSGQTTLFTWLEEGCSIPRAPREHQQVSEDNSPLTFLWTKGWAWLSCHLLFLFQDWNKENRWKPSSKLLKTLWPQDVTLQHACNIQWTFENKVLARPPLGSSLSTRPLPRTEWAEGVALQVSPSVPCWQMGNKHKEPLRAQLSAETANDGT